MSEGGSERKKKEIRKNSYIETLVQVREFSRLSLFHSFSTLPVAQILYFSPFLKADFSGFSSKAGRRLLQCAYLVGYCPGVTNQMVSKPEQLFIPNYLPYWQVF